MDLAELADRAVRIDRGGDQAAAAEHMRRAEASVEHVEMAHAVEQRQDRSFRPHHGSERFDRIVQVVGFATEEHEIERAGERIRRHQRRRREVHVPARAADHQPVLSESGRARGSHQEGHVPPCLQQAATEIAANAPCSNDKNAHARFPIPPAAQRRPSPGHSGWYFPRA